MKNASEGALGLGFLAAAAASHGFAPPRPDEVSPGTDTRARLEDLSDTPGRPDAITRDEDFWAEVQEAFTVDRSMVNLSNGGVSPTPGHVLEAMKRDLDYANQMPVYNGWQILEPQREGARRTRRRARSDCLPPRGRLGVGAGSCHLCAVTMISTRAPAGSAPASTAARAGGGPSKYLA